MADAFWVSEILTELASTRRGELKEFLAQCHRDAMSDPAKPFRAAFSTSAKSYDFYSAVAFPSGRTITPAAALCLSLKAWAAKHRPTLNATPEESGAQFDLSRRICSEKSGVNCFHVEAEEPGLNEGTSAFVAGD